MKKLFKQKSFYFSSAVLIFSCLGLFLNPIEAKADAFTVCGTTWDDPEDKFCSKTPDKYEIKISEMGLCTAEPFTIDNPSDSLEDQIFSAYSLANCHITMKPSSPVTVDLSSGFVNLGNQGGTKPANDTYTHAYIKLNNTFGLRGSHTIDSQTFYSNTDGSAVKDQAGGAKNFTDTLTSFDSESCSRSAAGDVGTGNMRAMLLSSDSTRATCSGNSSNATQILVSFDPSSDIVITDSIAGLEAKFKVINAGLSVDGEEDSDGNTCSVKICTFSSGPFRPSFTTY
ncbi:MULTISPECIES: hypothetical protein [Prochlorococcus]|uniref:Uncharacterized protein n=1 Tax=Prochlorococcus marinus (strain SARG / CCMP1375 / SS120) TaxID=167539 RepID=Q7VB12_PROMA|nr:MULTISPECIES: hypothetical protein [Prochlorococcus]AAQ00333.1 Predicted protein family PM-13 [Prochlorococcus marinus subsp. marinus str. CCMP1375]KGG10190.1 putative protein family PM-13 [Prochlorococcus marinus str. LG]KGG22216.1 putative protein family PM-13 [Prochlorococcus marinus str. SS2]KGG24467.1 putative protein family PM-13 [Prochlorococcus marinus str. SS35]KGG33362.1 putative protein family PM-13 [Prochlorococcus marinus str. SS51]